MPDYGLLGGIGSALSSFTDSYRQERGYQQQKQIQAQDIALKKRASEAASVDALSKFQGAGGYTDDQLQNIQSHLGLLPSSNQPQGFINSQSPQLSPDQSIVQSPSQMIRGSESTSDQGMINKHEISPQTGGYRPTAREFEIMSQYRAKGYNYDPRSMVVTKMGGPLGEAADVERQTKGVELKNKSMEQYDKFKTAWNSNEVKQNTDFADEAYGKVVNSYNNPSKYGDKALVLNLVKLDMGKQAAREGTLEHMQQNPQIMSKWGDYITQSINGTLSPQTRDDLVKTATTLRQSARQALEDQRQAAIKEAQANGVQPTFASDTAYKRMDKVASGIETKLPGNPSAPKEGGFMAKLNGFLPSSKASQSPTDGPKGKTVIQGGHVFTWNPKTGRYE